MMKYVNYVINKAKIKLNKTVSMNTSLYINVFYYVVTVMYILY